MATQIESNARRAPRGFSLVELLVVILIIAIIIAIVLPALSGVRGQAANAENNSLVTNIANSATTFYNDNRRAPGYFTPQEMGDATNQGRGLTAMQNAMLDLAGGVVKNGTAGSFLIGPSNTLGRQVAYLPESVGATGKGNYFTPPAKNMKLQNGVEGGTRVGINEHAQIAELVDGQGQPILAWVEDPTAKQTVQSVADFAAVAAPGNNPNNVAARFYLNSNYALLASTSFGKQRKNSFELSVLSPQQNNAAVSLAGAMGSPGAADDVSKNLNAILPTRSRGTFIVHAAGSDGVILNREGKKAVNVVENSGNNQTAALYFGANFKSLPGPVGTAIRDTSGKATSQDVLASFDDIIAASN